MSAMPESDFNAFWTSHALCDAVTRATLAFLANQIDYDQLLAIVREIFARYGVTLPASVIPPKPRPNLRIVR
jgi:hypothetical protein